VCVAETGHDVGELGVESIVRELVDLGSEDPKALNWVKPVTSAFERQMREGAAQDCLDSFNECESLARGERSG
jgi:hypothetical protein